jgi:hypothetical protein
MIRAINTAGLSEVEKRVVKATYDDLDPPKAKHVEALILLSADHELLPFLDRRIVSPLWNVCLKSLVLLHRLSLEGDERLLSELQSFPTLLSLPQRFESTAEAPLLASHAVFIQRYAAYLQAKVASFAAVKISCERYSPATEGRKWASKLLPAQLARTLPRLQTQFDRLLQCQTDSEQAAGQAIVFAAISLLIKDAFRLYSVLTILMLTVIGQPSVDIPHRLQ